MKVSTTSLSIMVWVASRVLASWKAYSLKVENANSWAARWLAFWGGTKLRVVSNRCLLGPSGQ